MNRKSILLAVDDSPASRRAVRYASEILSPDRVQVVLLFHVLAPLPPELLEHGGDSAAMERLQREQAEYRKQQEQADSGILLLARTQLLGAGLSESQVLTETSFSTDEHEVPDQILAATRRHGCDTVVIGRAAFSGIRNLFRTHVADRVVKEATGLSVWVVES